MSKVLIIKDASFENNAIEKINFNEPIFIKGSKINISLKSQGTAFSDAPTLSTNSQFICCGKANGEYYASYNTVNNNADNLHPIHIPFGKTKINVVCPNIAPLIVWYNDERGSDVKTERAYAKCIGGETSVGGSEWSISSWEYNSREFDIPNGATGFVLTFYCDNAEKTNGYNTDNISIKFS